MEVPPRPARTRFAPSPTGSLHLGHAFAALTAHRLAETSGGAFLLRIEDIDGPRCRPAFEAAIFEDLAWLGLTWPAPVWRQSDRLEAYGAALERLKALGLVYPCFCTRTEIAREIAASAAAPHGPDGPLYPGTCRALTQAEVSAAMAAGKPHAWRLDAARAAGHLGGAVLFEENGPIHEGIHAADAARLGDVVLARKDIATSYHLAVVVDDAAQGITLVTRGADLFPVTHLHRTLQALLGLPAPAYHHHRLIEDEDGTRLAKRHDALSLKSLRAEGVTPADIRARLGVA